MHEFIAGFFINNDISLLLKEKHTNLPGNVGSTLSIIGLDINI